MRPDPVRPYLATLSGGRAVRATAPEDVDDVVALEHAEHARDWVTQWPRERHLAALEDPDVAHLVLTVDGAFAGFAIVRGLAEPEEGVELARIAVARTGRGDGRALLTHLAARTFEGVGAVRLWLDVVPANARARAFYESLGFLREGTLRSAYVHHGVPGDLELYALVRPSRG